MLGEAAGCVEVGLRRIQVHEGGWSTPAHEHGRSEEIFYVLAGQGLSWQRGKDSAPLHCHSLEEEIFVMLDGDGVLVLDDEEETPVRPGSVVARPAGTGVSHLFRAGDGGLTYLAYGTRENGDICYYPRSNKINFGGVGVIGRVEKLDYWDGEL